MGVQSWLINLLSDPVIKNPCPVKAILCAGKAKGYTRQQLKQARKEIGVVSINIRGEQYWYLHREG